jgi:AraC-like DNA-binding protein
MAAAQNAGPLVSAMPSLHERQTFELDKPLRDARDAFEKAYFEFHLAKEDGSMTRVAEKTGLERTHLYRKFKHLGIDLNRRKISGAGESRAKADQAGKAVAAAAFTSEDAPASAPANTVIAMD